MRVSRIIILFILLYLIASFITISYASSAGKIAFEQSSGFKLFICIADEEGKNIQRLTDGSAPSWSPDGTKIAFVIAGDVAEFCKIYVMNDDGSDIKHLTESQDMSEYENNPSWYGTPFAIETQDSLIITWGSLKSK